MHQISGFVIFVAHGMNDCGIPRGSTTQRRTAKEIAEAEAAIRAEESKKVELAKQAVLDVEMKMDGGQ